VGDWAHFIRFLRVAWGLLMDGDHSAQAAQPEALPVLPCQLCRQHRHNLLAIFGALLLQHFFLNTLADVPVEHRKCGVSRLRHMLARSVDQATQFGEQGVARLRRGGLAFFFH